MFTDQPLRPLRPQKGQPTSKTNKNGSPKSEKIGRTFKVRYIFLSGYFEFGTLYPKKVAFFAKLVSFSFHQKGNPI